MVEPLLPPSREEKYLFVKAGKFRLYVFGFFSLVLLLAGMGMFLYHNPQAAWAYGPFAVLVFFYLIVSYAVGIFSRPFNFEKHEEVVQKGWPVADFPSIDIFYAICGEEFEVIHRALGYILDMAKKYPGSVVVHICDDSKNNVGIALAESYKGVGVELKVSRRPNVGHMKKAGNLKYAFDNSSNEFIIIFDADFCPSEDFLLETLPYMLVDEKVAIVQTPQYFCTDTHETWIGKGAAYVQELFYRLIQVNRDHWGGAICVGTNALYRRAALAPLGGTAQVPYSEDVRTGFRCLAAGWKLRYIPVIVAKGLCPDNMPAYLLQQHRWSLGSISLFFSKEFWVAPISFWQRLSFLTGMGYYLTTGLGMAFMYVPSIYMLIFAPEKVVWWSIFFSLPSLVFGTMYQAYWGRLKWGSYSILARQLAYYAHLFALLEFLTGNLTPWQPTGAASKTKIYERFQMMCFWVTSVSTFVIFGLVIYHTHQYGILPFLPTVFFTGLNYYIYMRLLRDQL